MESKLSKVIKGKKYKPLTAIFMGPEGCGKSSLAEDSESPIFVDIDDGSGHLDVARYPFSDDDPPRTRPNSFQEVIDATIDLATNPHPFKTVVYDTVDKLEGLLWKHCIERDKKLIDKEGTPASYNIESYGWGKGYKGAFDEWRKFVVVLDKLVDKGINVILISHTSIRPFKNPAGPDYDRIVMRIHESAAGLLREWVEVVGFMCFDEFAVSEGKNKKAKGVSTNRRLLKLWRTAAYDAKTRLPLPEEVEISADHPWQPLAKAIEESKGHTLSTLNLAILTELSRIADEEIIAKVTPFMDKATHEDNKAALFRLLNQLKAKPSKAESEQVQ
jgi:hypothetical protein